MRRLVMRRELNPARLTTAAIPGRSSLAASPRTTVPSPSGRIEFNTRTGICRRTAGAMLAG